MYCIDSRVRNKKRIFFINEVKDDDRDIILMLHGFPDNAYGFSSQIDSLKERFNIIAPFMHGVLNGERLEKDRITPRELIHDVLFLLREINPSGAKKVYLMGHDLGCFTCTSIAQISPYQIKGIIHINGLGLQQFCNRKFCFSQWVKSYYVLLAQFSFVRALVSKLFPDFFLRLIYGLSFVDKKSRLNSNNSSVFNSIYVYKYLFRKSVSLLGSPTVKLSVPTLFLWGNKDKFLNIPTLDEVDKYYVRGEVRVLPGGHWIHHNASEKVNRILTNWSGFSYE